MLNCRSCFFSCFFWLPGPQLLFRNSSWKAVRSPWYKKPQAKIAVQCTLLFFSMTGFQTVFFLLSHANKNPPLIKFWISNPHLGAPRTVLIWIRTRISQSNREHFLSEFESWRWLRLRTDAWQRIDELLFHPRTSESFTTHKDRPLTKGRHLSTDRPIFFKHVFQLAVGRVERQPLHAHPCFKNHSQHPSSWHHWWWLTESLKTVTD